jgi:hypothetical protein
VSAEGDNRLTGLELYSLERAGYFVRRGILDSDAVEQARDEVARVTCGQHAEGSQDTRITQLVELTQLASIRELAADLPIASGSQGDALVEMRCTLDFLCLGKARSSWERGIDLDPSLPSAEQLSILHRGHAAYHILVAIGAIDSLLMVPGSHAEPPSEQQWTALRQDPFADLPEAVRVRLGIGDVIVFSDTLLRRIDPGPTDDDCLREWPALHYTSASTLSWPVNVPDLSGKPR